MEGAPFIEAVSQVQHDEDPHWEEGHDQKEREGEQHEVEGHSLLLPSDQILGFLVSIAEGIHLVQGAC